MLLIMRIAVDIGSQEPYAWMITAGVLEYAARHRDVRIILLHARLYPEAEVPQTEWDALISQSPRKDFVGPQVSISGTAAGMGPVVAVNDEAVVDLVANEFLKIGLKSFAFVSQSADQRIGRLRFGLFKRLLATMGMAPILIELDTLPEEALALVPKPCGVMAVNDGAGISFLSLCKAQGISVPGEVNVISVDNTPACMDVSPTLSSVDVPFSWIGFRAAELCAKLVVREASQSSLQVEPTGMVLRESITAPGTGLDAVAAVAHFIRTHLDQPIVMEDLMRQHKLSRRRLEQVFRDARGTSPMAYLKSLRLDRAKHLLTHTNHTLGVIARDCGYLDSNRLCRAFRTTLGMTPIQYRNA